MTVTVLVPWTYIYIRLRPDRPTDDSDGAGAMDLYLHIGPWLVLMKLSSQARRIWASVLTRHTPLFPLIFVFIFI